RRQRQARRQEREAVRGRDERARPTASDDRGLPDLGGRPEADRHRAARTADDDRSRAAADRRSERSQGRDRRRASGLVISRFEAVLGLDLLLGLFDGWVRTRLRIGLGFLTAAQLICRFVVVIALF